MNSLNLSHDLVNGYAQQIQRYFRFRYLSYELEVILSACNGHFPNVMHFIKHQEEKRKTNHENESCKNIKYDTQIFSIIRVYKRCVCVLFF